MNIPIFHITDQALINEVPWFVHADSERIGAWDARNDMQLTHGQQVLDIPMGTHVMTAHAHHWDIAYPPFPRRYSVGSRHLNHPFARGALLSTIRRRRHPRCLRSRRLSVPVPELDRRGERIKMIVGTSIGSWNAGLLASRAHQPPPEAAAELIDIWGIRFSRSVRSSDVATLTGPGGPVLAPGRTPTALWLSSPSLGSRRNASRTHAAQTIDFDQLGRKALRRARGRGSERAPPPVVGAGSIR